VGQRFENLFGDSPRLQRAAILIALLLSLAWLLVIESTALLVLAMLSVALPRSLAAIARLLGIPVLAAGVTGVGWLLYFGSYSFLKDGVLLAAVVATMLVLHPSWRLWFREGCNGPSPLFTGRRAVRAGVIVAAVFWIASSATDDLTRPIGMSKPNATRFEELAHRGSIFEGCPVALALSGGGYRAALVHAGVLFALEDLGVCITGLSTVSGGAIVGSYYVTGGPPLGFLDIVQRRDVGLAREVTRFPTLIRLASPLRLPSLGIQLIPGEGYSRTRAQAEMLDRVFYSNIRLRELAEGNRPLLMLAASDLLSGDAIGITPHGIFVHEAGNIYDRAGASPLNSLWRSEWIPPIGPSPGDELLSRFVAASGAFPGALAPVPEHVEVFHPRGNYVKHLLLSDGGLTDNTGLALLLTALTKKPFDFQPREHWKPWQAKLVIASDGGQQLAQIHASEAGLGFNEQLSRTVDIIYATSGVRFVPPDYASPPKVLVLTSSIQSFRTPGWLSDANPMGKSMLQRGPLKAGLSLEDELAAAVSAFRRTATLSDVIDPEDARLLFRLGQFMVAHRWTGIWYALTGSPDAYAHVRGLTRDHDAVQAQLDQLRSLAPSKAKQPAK
jgi:predicted acylesterase/phospholipase RssA